MIPGKTLSASIVLYQNSLDDVLTAVKSFLGSGTYGSLYLIDNSPTDELKRVAEIDERIEYEHNSRNTGYVAHNRAIQKSVDADIKYHLVLNPDVSFGPSVVSQIIKFMDENSDIGLLLPKIFYPDGQLQYACKLLPTPFDFFLRMLFPQDWIMKRMNSFELRISGYDKIMNVPYMSGCFMFLRNSTLKEIGLFDERFFMYAEDIDLSRRVHAHSRSVFNPDVSIIHRNERASYKSWKLFWVHFTNVCRYFNKYGWFFDKHRKDANREILAQFNP